MSLPIMSVGKKLTWKQRRLVERHLKLADQAAKWLRRVYRSCGMSFEEAQSDAYAWLVFSALRFKPRSKTPNAEVEVLGGAVFLPPENPKPASFATHYWSNIKWWRLDISGLRTRELKNRKRTVSLHHMASLLGDDGQINEMEELAVLDQGPWVSDQPEQENHLRDMVLKLVPDGKVFWDSVLGMTHDQIAKKHRLSSRKQATRVIVRARAYILEFLMDRLFS